MFKALQDDYDPLERVLDNLDSLDATFSELIDYLCKKDCRCEGDGFWDLHGDFEAASATCSSGTVCNSLVQFALMARWN